MVRFYKLLGSSFGIYPESDLLSPPPLTTLIQTTIILLWIYCNSLLTGLISTFALLDSILNLEAKVMSVEVYAYLSLLCSKLCNGTMFLSEKNQCSQWSPRPFQDRSPVTFWTSFPLLFSLAPSALTLLVFSDNPGHIQGPKNWLFPLSFHFLTLHTHSAHSKFQLNVWKHTKLPVSFNRDRPPLDIV